MPELPDISDSDLPNLKQWYRDHADETSVTYREFIKRIHRASHPRSGIHKRFVADGKLDAPARRARKPSKALPRS